MSLARRAACAGGEFSLRGMHFLQRIKRPASFDRARNLAALQAMAAPAQPRASPRPSPPRDTLSDQARWLWATPAVPASRCYLKTCAAPPKSCRAPCSSFWAVDAARRLLTAFWGRHSARCGRSSQPDPACALPCAAVVRYSAPGIRPGGRLPFFSRKERQQRKAWKSSFYGDIHGFDGC